MSFGPEISPYLWLGQTFYNFLSINLVRLTQGAGYSSQRLILLIHRLSHQAPREYWKLGWLSVVYKEHIIGSIRGGTLDVESFSRITYFQFVPDHQIENWQQSIRERIPGFITAIGLWSVSLPARNVVQVCFFYSTSFGFFTYDICHFSSNHGVIILFPSAVTGSR